MKRISKTLFKNYFRGFKNDWRDKIYEYDGKYYFTNKISLVRINSNYGLEVDSDKERGKILHDMIDRFECFYNFGYTDEITGNRDYRCIKDMVCNVIIPEYQVNALQIEKISNLLKAREHKTVLKNVNSTSAMKYIVKIENADDEVGYLLPIKIY